MARVSAALAGIALLIAVAAWLLRDEAVNVREAAQRGAAVERFEIESEAVGDRQPVTVIVPAEAQRGAPLLVFLHGRGGDDRSELDNQILFDTLESLGAKAPLVAFPDGGDSSYWHDRETGDWGSYVVDEVVPEVAERFDADPQRVAIGGISMGGFGALNLARLQPGRFCAVGAHSPALWQSAGETAAGAFDDAEDFAVNDVIAAVEANPSAFGEQALWLDTGDSDPFLPGFEALDAALEEGGVSATTRVGEGGHDDAYWRQHWYEYVRFYARELERCGR